MDVDVVVDVVVVVVVDEDKMLDREQEVLEQAHASHLVLTVCLAPTLSCVAMQVVHDDVHVHVEAYAVRVLPPHQLLSRDLFTRSEI